MSIFSDERWDRAARDAAWCRVWCARVRARRAERAARDARVRLAAVLVAEVLKRSC